MGQVKVKVKTKVKVQANVSAVESQMTIMVVHHTWFNKNITVKFVTTPASCSMT